MIDYILRTVIRCRDATSFIAKYEAKLPFMVCKGLEIHNIGGFNMVVVEAYWWDNEIKKICADVWTPITDSDIDLDKWVKVT